MTGSALPDNIIQLPRTEFEAVLAAPNAADLCVGGIVDEDSGLVVLYRGDLSSITVPLTAFVPSGDGIKPDPTRFAVIDYGQTISFGDYEAAFDAIVSEWARPNAMAADDLEAIITLLELAAINLTSEPGATFTADDLFREAGDIGGDDIALDRRDVQIVLNMGVPCIRNAGGKRYCLG